MPRNGGIVTGGDGGGCDFNTDSVGLQTSSLNHVGSA